jgi:alanine racemase
MADADVNEGPATIDGLDQRARVWAEIDVAALENNYLHLASRVPVGTKILAVLKADAYGHGAVLCAKVLSNLGVSMIGVGDSREALELRAAGVQAPLLVLGAIVEGEMRAVVENDVASCIHSAQRAKLLSQVAKALGRRARVHLKIDTGMGRLGVRPEIARELAGAIGRDPNLELEGVCTHYGSAASPVPFHTSEQVTSFVKLVQEIRADGVAPPLVHASNSAAVFSTLSEHFTMIRVGLGLFGVNPGNLPIGESPVKPVLSLRTQVVFLKDLPGGSPVGYNRTHVTKRPTRIAIVPFGYSDGYPYALSNRAHVLVRGERAPVVGAVSMDYTTLDVTDVKGVQVGDEVTVVGTSGKRRIAVEDLARVIGTIPYEITARLGRRVARVAV